MDSKIKLWDLKGNLKATISDPSDEITSLDWHQKGNALVCGCQDGSLWLFNGNKGQCLGGFYGHEADVTQCGFTPDGKSILSVSLDGTLRIWNPKTMQVSHKITGYNFHEKNIHTYAFASNNNWVLSGDAQGLVCLSNISNGKVLGKVEVE